MALNDGEKLFFAEILASKWQNKKTSILQAHVAVDSGKDH